MLTCPINVHVLYIVLCLLLLADIWANLYAFKLVLFDWQLALCTFLLPYAGKFYFMKNLHLHNHHSLKMAEKRCSTNNLPVFR